MKVSDRPSWGCSRVQFGSCERFFVLLWSFDWFSLCYVICNTVQALMGIQTSLLDPHNALENLDGSAVDPCSWAMVTCSPENLVIIL